MYTKVKARRFEGKCTKPCFVGVESGSEGGALSERIGNSTLTDNNVVLKFTFILFSAGHVFPCLLV